MDVPRVVLLWRTEKVKLERWKELMQRYGVVVTIPCESCGVEVEVRFKFRFGSKCAARVFLQRDPPSLNRQ